MRKENGAASVSPPLLPSRTDPERTGKHNPPHLQCVIQAEVGNA